MNNDWREYIGDQEYVLIHYGIKGQKWGVRRFENSDGTLTPAGRARYGDSSDKIESNLKRSSKYENRAVNAKTSIGRSLATAQAIRARQKADKLASKAEGTNKGISNKLARNTAAAAETESRIAEGLKKRAESSKNSRKADKLMDNAVEKLAKAENLEQSARSFKAIANSHGVKKGGTVINEIFKSMNNQYTSAGRKKKLGDVAVEKAGDAIISKIVGQASNKATKTIDQAAASAKTKQAQIGLKAAKIGVKVGSKLLTKDATEKARDSMYKNQNSAKRRYDEILKDKSDQRSLSDMKTSAMKDVKGTAKSLFNKNSNEKAEKKYKNKR